MFLFFYKRMERRILCRRRKIVGRCCPVRIASCPRGFRRQARRICNNVGCFAQIPERVENDCRNKKVVILWNFEKSKATNGSYQVAELSGNNTDLPNLKHFARDLRT